MDGNTVGQQGSQIIAQTAASSIVENLIISTVNCDFKAASGSSKFSLLGMSICMLRLSCLSFLDV